MMMLPAGVKVHIAAGVTDMRKGMDGLAMLVEAVLREDPFSGQRTVLAGRLVEHGDMRLDPLFLDQPCKHLCCAIGGIASKAFGLHAKAHLCTLDHRHGSADLSRTDGT